MEGLIIQLVISCRILPVREASIRVNLLGRRMEDRLPSWGNSEVSPTCDFDELGFA
jgi:hypothetical protein